MDGNKAISKSVGKKMTEKESAQKEIERYDCWFFQRICVLIALFVRFCVSLSPYSGYGKPPMYGDYEAQRHWMEITYNLPIKNWYVNSTFNDLQYWGLDYPPLTAYHSWFCGFIAYKINPDWVRLKTSQGYESSDHKRFMRYTVLAADLLIYFPAAYAFCSIFYKKYSKLSQISIFFSLLLQPGLILIDHGHFRLALWAVVLVIENNDVLGSVMFCLALNYKQMELYHALPFFSFLLGKALKEISWFKIFYKIFCLGITVIITFALCWLPFLLDVQLASQVLHRLFPFARGLYEDKVANVWCSLSIFVKLKNLFSQSTLLAICGSSTLFLLLPSNIMLAFCPSSKSFLLSLVNSSLVFFLFSFQVHEKSILLAALPASLLISFQPVQTTWFLFVACFSMTPLLEKDGLLLAYIPCMMIFLFANFSFHEDFKKIIL